VDRPALDWIDRELQKLTEAGLRRALEPLGPRQGPVVEVRGRTLVNLCSNDYLGLAGDARVMAAAAEAARRDGAGSGASRLVAGDLPIHGRLEAALAALHGAEAALLFNSGYHANAGVPAVLVGRDDALFSDELNHASIIDGALLSRAGLQRYRHGDAQALADLLARSTARRKLVITDAVFSMDGDAAPLGDLADACRRHGAMLYVDEAHAVGVLGPTGAGLAEQLGLKDRVDVEMGTLGKALGAFGAYVAGEGRLRELLLSRARTFVFTTALPPAACGAALAALEIVRTEPERRARLHALMARFRAGLLARGFDVARVVSPIFPVVLGSEGRALAAAAGLRERGFYVRAIRPPTVPRGTSRLRVALAAGHTEAQLDAFLLALDEVLAGLPPGRPDPAAEAATA
jgi:8-amino-7-oxononanoate synthase